MLPFLPAVAATLLFLRRRGQQEEDETCFKKFIKHLPGFQILTHKKKLTKVAKLQNDIFEWQKRINQLKKQAETETKNNIEYREKEILKAQNNINAIKTDLQRFKIFAAVLESTPQFILQCSIRLKSMYTNEFIEWTDPIFWLQTSSSIVSVFLTFTGLVCEMPILVHETERPPIRSFSYTYTKVLPLVVLGATPQLLTLAGILSFATFEDWLFYIPFGIGYGGLLVAGSMAIKKWMKIRYPIIKRKPSVSTLIDLGLISSIICPSVIGVLDSGFLFATSVTTTMIHSVALGSLGHFGVFKPDWVFNSNTRDIQIPDASSFNGTEIDPIQVQEEDQYGSIFWYLKMYCWILIPALLLLSNLIAHGIETVFMAMNDLYIAFWACEADRIEMVQDKPSLTNKLSDLVPADQDNNTLMHYCSQRNDEVSAQLIVNCDDQELDLSQENSKGKTALMIACEKAHPKTVQSFFKKASEGVKIGVNDTEDYQEGNSALHFAVLSNGPIKAKKEVVFLFWSFAKQLEIDLLIKNSSGKTPIDILEESQVGQSWLEKLGNPKEDLNLLQPLKKAIEDKDFHRALAVMTKFIMPFKALFYAIEEKNEELAIAMIDNCQRLNISLSVTDGWKTPLILACIRRSPKIANAILCQAKAQDIAINAKDDDVGRTAFIFACEYGLTAFVAMILEMAQDIKIDLNAKDDLKRTGFIFACEYKHSEVIDLILATAESLKIDLEVKDKSGKSGFDYFPQHFQK